MDTKQLFLFALIGVLPISSFADYRMNVKFSDPSSISFGAVSNPGEGTPEEPPTDPEDSCPTNFPQPTMASGFPSIVKSGANVSYSVQVTSAGGYSTYAEITGGERFVKMLTTSVSGVDYGNGALYAGTTQGWLVKTGQTINVVVTPIAYDMQEGTPCPITGTPFTLINKTHAQLYSEAQ
jgi:hypothetical protein